MSMGRYCQERATQVLDDFAAVGTFLLNCEETVSGMAWIVSQLNEQVECRGILCCIRRSSPAFSAAPIPKRPKRERAPQRN